MSNTTTKATFATAKQHGLQPGTVFLFCGNDPKAPGTRELVHLRKAGSHAFTLYAGAELNRGKRIYRGGHASKFWAAPAVPTPASKRGALDSVPAKYRKAADSLRSKKATVANEEPKKATTAKAEVPAKKAEAPKGVEYRTSGKHGLKEGSTFLFHGSDKEAPNSKGVKLTLRIVDRVWITGVNSSGTEKMRVHIAKPFWAEKVADAPAKAPAKKATPAKATAKKTAKKNSK